MGVSNVSDACSWSAALKADAALLNTQQLQIALSTKQQCGSGLTLIPAPIKFIRTSLASKLRLAPQAPSRGWQADLFIILL